jgi:myo-inositol-1(or 4)-monophosphatase
MSKKDRFYQLLRLAESVALLAGHHLKANQASWKKVKSSAAHDIKVRADTEAESYILKQLAMGSDIPILSEESGYTSNKKSEIMWIVDPLDGSLNYHQKIPFCCVSIALYKGQDAILGVVYDFNSDELFSGLVGTGAWLNHIQIFPSDTSKTSKAILGTGFPAMLNYSSDSLNRFVSQVQKFRKVRLLGSAALSLSYVASGRLDAYCEQNIMAWDIAAGCALVKASGGNVSIEFGEDMFAPVTVVANNGKLPYEPYKTLSKKKPIDSAISQNSVNKKS